jgi:hypothetical protein
MHQKVEYDEAGAIYLFYVHCTTYHSLEQWFDSWEETLSTLGFAFQDA